MGRSLHRRVNRRDVFPHGIRRFRRFPNAAKDQLINWDVRLRTSDPAYSRSLIFRKNGHTSTNAVVYTLGHDEEVDGDDIWVPCDSNGVIEIRSSASADADWTTLQLTIKGWMVDV